MPEFSGTPFISAVQCGDPSAFAMSAVGFTETRLGGPCFPTSCASEGGKMSPFGSEYANGVRSLISPALRIVDQSCLVRRLGHPNGIFLRIGRRFLELSFPPGRQRDGGSNHGSIIRFILVVCAICLPASWIGAYGSFCISRSSRRPSLTPRQRRRSSSRPAAVPENAREAMA